MAWWRNIQGHGVQKRHAYCYWTVLMGAHTSIRGPPGPGASTKSQVYFVTRSVTEWPDPHYMMGTSRIGCLVCSQSGIINTGWRPPRLILVNVPPTSMTSYTPSLCTCNGLCFWLLSFHCVSSFLVNHLIAPWRYPTPTTILWSSISCPHP